MTPLISPSQIIIHHSLTKDGRTLSWPAIRYYHVNVNHWTDCGYHYGLELYHLQYEILTGRMMTEQGAHCLGCNHDSLGVCFVGNFDKAEPATEQWELGLRLVHSLMTVFNIPSDQVYGHRHFARKTCPGLFFNMDRFRAELLNMGDINLAVGTFEREAYCL